MINVFFIFYFSWANFFVFLVKPDGSCSLLICTTVLSTIYCVALFGYQLHSVVKVFSSNITVIVTEMSNSKST